MRELEKQNLRLQVTIGKLDLALSPINEAILWTDMDGVIGWCNDSFADLCGIIRLSALGKSMSDILVLYPDNSSDVVASDKYPIYKSNKSRVVSHGVYNSRDEHGKTRVLELSTYYVASVQDDYLSILIRDITESREREEAIRDLNNQLVISAKKIGKAELASSIIHNIGNVLNGINVSLGILTETSHNSNFNALFSVVKMLDSTSDVKKYLQDDEKGKLIPPFLSSICGPLERDYTLICDEVSNINTGVINIREIIAAQQSVSKISGALEKVDLTSFVDLVVQSLFLETSQKKISVKKDYNSNAQSYIDKSILYQILLNLFRNSIDALDSVTFDDGVKLKKEIIVSVRESKTSDTIVEIVVEDNGVGICPEDLTHVFNEGFTRKENGQGIGLYSSVVYAKELGGNIKVQSQGINKGATFIIELPIIDNQVDS